DRALNGPSGLHALEDNLIVTLFDRLDAEARPLVDHQHALERRIVLHFFKTQHPRELFDEANVHGGPARVFLRALWIEIIARLVKLKGIGIVLAHDLAEADDARRLGVGMVKEDEIAELHFTHEVARLIVADSLPDGRSITFEIVDGIDVGLALHEPNSLCHARIMAVFGETAWKPLGRAQPCGATTLSLNCFSLSRKGGTPRPTASAT